MNKRIYPPLQETIAGFLNLVRLVPSNDINSLNELSIYLDELSLIYHLTNDVEANDPKAPQRPDYEKIRNLAAKRFPDLGFYNIPEKLTQELGETKIVTGDAIDDVVDIACDLSEVMYYLENGDAKDALWHFRFGYKHHWGNHLRQLQLYLYSLSYER